MASMVACLICVPLIFAGIIACISNDKVRGYVVYVGGVVIMGLVVATVYKYAVASSMFSKLEPITFELPYNEVLPETSQDSLYSYMRFFGDCFGNELVVVNGIDGRSNVKLYHETHSY